MVHNLAVSSLFHALMPTTSFGQNPSDSLLSKVWCRKHFKTAVKIGNFSDSVNEAFGVKTEAKEQQYHQQILPTTSGLHRIKPKSLVLVLKH